MSGFNITKFICNNEKVLRSINEGHRIKDDKEDRLTFGYTAEDKALEDKGNRKINTLGFQIKLAENPSTKSRLLSTIISIYDLLCLGAPFLLNGRLINQQLCKVN